MALMQLAPPYPIFTDKNGDPLDNGYLYFGEVNKNPETNPIQVYYDSAFTQPAAQPLRTSNGYVMRNGSPALIYAGSQFSVTVRDKNNALVIYSPVGYGIDPGSVTGTVVYDDFTGDGATVNFTLSASPSTKNATNVYIDGVYQSKDNYDVSGATLTFSTAPPLNSAIEVVTQESSIIGGASSQQITYTQGGVGSVTRTVQSRLRDFVSVKDFGAVGDGVTDDTNAINNALVAAKRVYMPAGTYLVTRAIRMNQLGSGRILMGDGKEQTEILRTDTTAETIDGVSVQCVLFVNNGDHHITDLSLRGYTGTLTGTPSFTLDGLFSEDPYRGKVENVRIRGFKRGIYAKQPWAMIYSNILVRDASQTAFDFSSASGKTSLSFTTCVCENVANAFLLTNAYYSAMTACAADYVNYTDASNPYGRGYGSRASDKGIYHIDGGDVTLNGCGSENSYGNGVVCLGTDNSSDVTINNLTSFGTASTYVPPTTGWAVGPIQCGNGPKSVIINGGRFTYSNSAVGSSNPIADIVAFNYDEGAYGARDVTMVTVNSLISPRSAYPFAGRGNHTRYCRYGDSTPVAFTKTLTGSGTVLTIPIIGNNALNYRHLIRLLAVNNQSNSSAPIGTEATIQLSSFTSINAPSLAYWNDQNIASVASTGLNLEITLTSSLTNPTVMIEPLYAGRFGTAPGSGNYQPFIDFENMSIA